MTMTKQEVIAEVAKIYKVLSNERRIQIVTCLMEVQSSVSVSQICDLTKLDQPVVSKQLNLLHRFQIVCKEKHGNKVLYGVDDPHIVEMISDMINHVKHELVGKPHPKNLF